MKKNISRLLQGLTLAGVLTIGMVAVPAGAGASGGFNQYGYNWTARNFVGTYMQWCEAYLMDTEQCLPYTFGSVSDLLIMKWNAAWDNCNATYTSSNPNGDPTVCQGAWVDNESIGTVPGGSGNVWHYKIAWSDACYTSGGQDPGVGGGAYCVWGNYVVLMDQGTFQGTHTWNALATPNGYGTYR